MNRFRDSVLLVVVCAMIAGLSPADVQAGIEVNLVEVVDPGGPVHELHICEWIELPTNAGSTLSWYVHADEPNGIPDLLIGSWDDSDYLVPGWSVGSFFDGGTSRCTYSTPGGPPGVPPKDYFQTLHLDGGPGLAYCTYLEISISEVPMWYDSIEQQYVPQDIWIHPTPEPGTFCLLALGGVLLARMRR